MKLYYHPVSTVSRPIMMFAADNHIALDYKVVDLMTGEHMKPEYAAINPSCAVPTLEDGEFRMTESSAILKYLADKFDSPAYPKDLQKRGWRFVGPTTVYAFMQAMGLVNDHLDGCHVRDSCTEARRAVAIPATP